MNDFTAPDWIALHLGTETLRIWPMKDGRPDTVVACTSPPPPWETQAFDSALGSLLDTWNLPPETPILGCGVFEAGRRNVPCKPLDAVPVPLPHSRFSALRVIPGVSQTQPPDLLGGAEIAIAGFLSLNGDWDGVICLPGARSRWVQVSAGEIISFQSFLTGEMIALLAQSPGLRAALQGGDWEQSVFDDALAQILSRPEKLAAGLASIEAEAQLDGINPTRARARLSGLLIGAELAAAKPYWLGQNIAILGSSEASAPYRAALESQGVPAILADHDRMLLEGLKQARRLATGG
ncbi:2-dehydro-3-deoxygalactonokinase [Sulfitobacter aestuarii]|uniref:2-dehydro-3-deoxygalactonokinase n=1 Tax=Sulfitobacter aestuarii TaxID=2161676 RepID=A0ABW5U3K6_9RHOB